MEKFIGGTERIPLTPGLLDLIVMVQDYERFLRSQSMFNNKHHLDRVDVDREVERFFIKIDDSVLRQYKLSKNKISLNKVLNYVVTDEILNTQYDELPKKFMF